MLKRFLLIFICIFCFALLSCSSKPIPPEPGTEGELSEQQEMEISRAYEYYMSQLFHFKYEPDRLDYEVIQYYGNYNDAIVVYVNIIGASTTGEVKHYTEEIAGYELSVYANSLPVVYKDGAIYPLGTAYQSGIISKQDVYTIGCLLSPYKTEDGETVYFAEKYKAP